MRILPLCLLSLAFPALLPAQVIETPPNGGGITDWRRVHPESGVVRCLTWLEDRDGDGHPEILIGNYGHFFAAVYSSETGDQLAYIGEGPYGNDYGAAVARLTDVTGDGVNEYLVSAPTGTFGGLVEQGSVYVYNGATDTRRFRFNGESDHDEFGFSLASGADFDGDGYHDLLIGAPSADLAGLDQGGSVYVYSGRTNLLIRRLDGTDTHGRFGHAVASCGDLNGDGVDEILVGAPGTGNALAPDYGAVYVFSGSDGTLLHSILEGTRPSKFGWALDRTGDTDGDGFCDFLVGAPKEDVGPDAARGVVRVFSGSDFSTLFTLEGSHAEAHFGHSVAGDSDFNGDGNPDFIIGEPQFDLVDRNQDKAGAIRIYSGLDVELLGVELGLALDNAQATDHRLGDVVVSAPDMDLDGKGDFLSSGSRKSCEAWTTCRNPTYRFGGAWVLTHTPFLEASHDSLSAATGGTVDFFLDFPTSHMGVRSYQLLASASGNTPFNYQSINIPLESNDSIFQAMLGGATGNMFSVPIGGPLVRGSDGNIDISLTIAPGQVNHMIGTTLYFSAVDIGPGWPKRASVAVPLEILP